MQKKEFFLHKANFLKFLKIFENVLIIGDGNNVLNSKSEFNHCQIPRISVMYRDQSNVAHFSIEEIEIESKKKDKDYLN